MIDADKLITDAVEAGKDRDYISMLVDLKIREDRAREMREYFEAFAEFQARVPVIYKLKEGHNYKYAPLGDIASQIRDLLKECRLVYRFDIKDDGEEIQVSCLVSHVNGWTETRTMRGNPDTSGNKTGIQSRGSAVSYLQRYTLIAALGLTTADEDIDARLDPTTISPEQVAELRNRIAATNSDEARFCKALAVASLEEILANNYSRADQLLRDKEART